MSRAEFDERYRCTATAKQTGERCKRRAAPGADVCVIHGGRSPQARAAAAHRLQRRHLEGDLGALLAELELDASGRDPVDALLDAVHRCWAMAKVLGALTGGLSTSAGSPDAMWGPNHLGDGAPHVLTTMYGQWLERAARASKLAIDAGVEERRVQLAERVGAVMVDVLRGVLDDIGLTEEQREAAVLALPRRFELVAGDLED